ncbi:unnamed protein product, partial [Tetraodon nigroviridis]
VGAGEERLQAERAAHPVGAGRGHRLPAGLLPQRQALSEQVSWVTQHGGDCWYLHRPAHSHPLALSSCGASLLSQIQHVLKISHWSCSCSLELTVMQSYHHI